MATLITYATLNDSQLQAGLAKVNASVGQTARKIESASQGLTQSVERAFKGVALRLVAYGALFELMGLPKQIIEVRGQFQQLSIAFETMLGSKEKADRIMAESISLAQKTPFTLMDVTTNAKQLMAMGVSFEKVMGTIKNLGDVAAGVSVPLSRIAINYGQVLTLGKLQMREIRDFAMAGVPLIGELSKNLNRSTAEITAMVSKGLIGFKDVERAFQTMSEEGGKFYNLMEKQNASVTGQISNLVDKWQVMLNEIGKSNEGTIYNGIKYSTKLVENYEIIGKTLLSLIATYGVYKVALMSVAAAEKLNITRQSVAAFFSLAKSIRSAADAQALLNLVTKANPYVLLLTAITAIAGAMWVFSKNTNLVKENLKALNEQIADEKSRVLLLVQAIDNENLSRAERNKNLNTLISLSPSVLKGINLENVATAQSTAAINTYLESLRTKIRLQQIDKQLSESIAREEEAKKYNQPKSFLQKVGIASGLYTFKDFSKQSGDIVAVEQALQKDLLNAAKDLTTKSANNVEELLSPAIQLKNTLSEIATIEQTIKDIRSGAIKAKDPAKEIKDQQSALDEAKSRRDVLMGIDEKTLSKQEKIDKKRQQLLEQRNKNELFAAVTLQGKLLKVEEETTRQKIDIAANEYQKSLAELEKNKIKTIADINNLNRSLNLPEVSKLSGTDLDTYNQGIKAAEQVFMAAKVEINRQAAEEIDRIWQEVEDYRLTGYEKEKAALNKKFFEEEQQLKKLYTDQQQLQIALAVLFGTYKQKEQDIDIKYRDNALQLDLELEYSKNQISENGLDRESKINKKNLDSYIKNNEARIENLKTNLSEENKLKIAQLELDNANAKDAEKKRVSDLKSAEKNIDAMGSILNKVLSSTSSNFAKEIGSTIEEVTGAISSLQKREKENVFGKVTDIASLVIALVTAIFKLRNLIRDGRKAFEESKKDFQDEQLQTQLQYDTILNKQLRVYEDSNIFITDYAKAAESAAMALVQAQENFQKAVAQAAAYGTTIWDMFSSGLFKLNEKTGLIEYTADLKKALEGLEIQVGTTAKTWNFLFIKIATGSTPVYDSLLKVYPKLIDESGKFNVELAKTILAMEGIPDATRRSLEGLVAYQEQIDAANEALNSAISSIAGSISGDLYNALKGAWEAGTDSFTAFKDSVSKGLKEIINQMVFNAIFTDTFTQLQNDLRASFGVGGDMNVTDDIAKLLSAAPELLAAWKTAMAATEGAAKEAGFDWSGGTQANGLSGQIQRTITESTGQELAGLWRRQFDDTRIIRDYTKVGITYLLNIDRNTANTVLEIQKSNEELKRIVKNTTTQYTGVL